MLAVEWEKLWRMLPLLLLPLLLMLLLLCCCCCWLLEQLLRTALEDEWEKRQMNG